MLQHYHKQKASFRMSRTEELQHVINTVYVSN